MQCGELRSVTQRNVGKRFRRLRGDRLLADTKSDRGVRCDREHHVRRIVGQRAAVPLGEAEYRRGADRIREHVGEEPVCDFLRVGPRILRGSLGADDTCDRLDRGRTVGLEVIGGAPGVEPVAEVLVILRDKGWIIGRPMRLIERQPPASVASVATAQTPMRRFDPASASSSLSGTSSTIEYTV